jgi:peptide/nickel transport system ATP-binding protein
VRPTSTSVIDVIGLSVGLRDRTDGSILDNVSLSVPRGGIYGIAGESGCGKSTLLLAMMGAFKPGLRVLQGDVRLGEQSLLTLAPAALNSIRGRRVALVPQNAGQSLTPTLRIGAQIKEAIRLHTTVPRQQHDDHAMALLAKVKLPDPAVMMRRYPHEISGGQQQRVAIAMALAGEPELLLLDEPTTGLDVTVKLHVLELLQELHAASGVSIVCVSHDIGLLADMASTIVVMYRGQIIEQQPTEDLLRRPLHPYTYYLLRSVPSVGRSAIPPSIPGTAGVEGMSRDACRFVDRCPHAEVLCREVAPTLIDSGAMVGSTAVRCHYPNSVAIWSKDRRDEELTVRSTEDRVVLSIDDLSVSYVKPRGFFTTAEFRRRVRPVVSEVSLQLRRGELLGLVGESGSGKSTILRTVAGLWPSLTGQIRLDDGTDLGKLVVSRDRNALRRVQMIFQNPDASLNPRQQIRAILAKPLTLYFGLKGRELNDRIVELLDAVRLGEAYQNRYPGQLSGGEKQRIAIARAFAARPDVILCDEITSALDISVQASILRLMKDLSLQHGTSSLFVTHDLGVVRALCDRVAVLFKGSICEFGDTDSVCDAPSHDYTRLLLRAVRSPLNG